MGKKIIFSSIFIAFIAIVVAPTVTEASFWNKLFGPADVTSSTTPAKNITNIIRKTATAVNLACMQTAVGKRDTAIISAFDAFYTTTKQALETRKAAMVSAWGITDKAQRKTALTTAWKTYRDTQKAARQTLNKARKEAWQTFYTDRKACGTTGASEDSGTEAMDVNL